MKKTLTMFGFALLFASPLLAIQSSAKRSAPASPTNKPEPMSPVFKAAAVDALACLDSIQDNILETGSALAPQKIRCDELISKVALLKGTVKSQRDVYGSLGTMESQLDLCRIYVESGRHEDFGDCLDRSDSSRRKAEVALGMKTRQKIKVEMVKRTNDSDAPIVVLSKVPIEPIPGEETKPVKNKSKSK